MTDVDETIAEGDAALSTMGSFDIEDVDVTDVVTVSNISVAATGNTSGAPSLAGLFTAELGDTIIDGVSTTGTVDWTFDTLAGDFDYLAVGENIVITYTVEVSDDNMPLVRPRKILLLPSQVRMTSPLLPLKPLLLKIMLGLWMRHFLQVASTRVLTVQS